MLERELMEVKNYSQSIAEVALCTVHHSFFFLRKFVFVFVLFPLRASLIGSPNLFLEIKHTKYKLLLSHHFLFSLCFFKALFLSTHPLCTLSHFCLSNVSKQSIAKVTHCTLVSSDYKFHFHYKRIPLFLFFSFYFLKLRAK